MCKCAGGPIHPIMDRPAHRKIIECCDAVNDVRLERKVLTPHVTKQPEDKNENKNRGYAAAAKFPGGCAR
jgi:hypothetical protein